MFNQYKPLTNSIFFLEIDSEQALSLLLKWRGSLGQKWLKKKVSANLSRTLEQLLPITTVAITKFLILGTKTKWSAFLDNHFGGTDPSALHYLSKKLKCRMIMATCSNKGVAFEYKDPNQPKYTDENGFESHKDDHYIYYSKLEAKGYRFEAAGKLLFFEKKEGYKKSYAEKQFTPDMLKKYLSEFGIEAFDEDFYSPHAGFLLTRVDRDIPKNVIELTLEEAKNYYRH